MYEQFSERAGSCYIGVQIYSQGFIHDFLGGGGVAQFCTCRLVGGGREGYSKVSKLQKLGCLDAPPGKYFFEILPHFELSPPSKCRQGFLHRARGGSGGGGGGEIPPS